MSSVQSRPSALSSTPCSYSYRTLHAGGPAEPLHAHAEATTIHVLEGVVYLITEEDERPMTPGDQATIPAGELHRVFNAGDGDAHLCEG
jgi:quercetin dioxygenase-like cupin family protein